jgi:hypothetical protein
MLYRHYDFGIDIQKFVNVILHSKHATNTLFQ